MQWEMLVRCGDRETPLVVDHTGACTVGDVADAIAKYLGTEYVRVEPGATLVLSTGPTRRWSADRCRSARRDSERRPGGARRRRLSDFSCRGWGRVAARCLGRRFVRRFVRRFDRGCVRAAVCTRPAGRPAIPDPHRVRDDRQGRERRHHDRRSCDTRHHLRLSVSDVVEVHDLGSFSGTLIDGHAIGTARVATVMHGFALATPSSSWSAAPITPRQSNTG